MAIWGATPTSYAAPAFEQQFDQLGAEGFELAWILMNQKLHGEKDGHVAIFKRAITS